MKKKILLILSVFMFVAILTVGASATISMTFDIQDATTDTGDAVNKIVLTMTDDESDWRSIQVKTKFNYDKIIPIDWYDGTVPSYTGEAAEYPFVFNSFKSGRTSTAELSRPQVPVWTINGSDSEVVVELYWGMSDTYPITASDTMIYEMYFKYAEGVTKDDLVASDFNVYFAWYVDEGQDHFIGNTDNSKNDIVLTNNVVPEAAAITVPVLAGDIIYLQDGTTAVAEADGDYEVLAQDGFVVVNTILDESVEYSDEVTSEHAQKIYVVSASAATATLYAENAIAGSDVFAIRDHTPIEIDDAGNTADRNGLRLKMTHAPETKGLVTEYGFLTTTEKFIANGLDMALVEAGQAKSGKAWDDTMNDGTWFAQTDEMWDIRATFYNIPLSKSGVQTKIYTRPYAKLGDTVVYGEVTSMSLYEACSAIYNNEDSFAGCEESMQEYIKEVIGLVEGYVVEDEVIIDISGLYN